MMIVMIVVVVVMMTFTHSTGNVDIETGGDEDRGGEGKQEEEGEVVHDEAGEGFSMKNLRIIS